MKTCTLPLPQAPISLSPVPAGSLISGRTLKGFRGRIRKVQESYRVAAGFNYPWLTAGHCVTAKEMPKGAVGIYLWEFISVRDRFREFAVTWLCCTWSLSMGLMTTSTKAFVSWYQVNFSETLRCYLKDFTRIFYQTANE